MGNSKAEGKEKGSGTDVEKGLLIKGILEREGRRFSNFGWEDSTGGPLIVWERDYGPL